MRCDISRHRSKSVEEFTAQPLDFVITVCDSANETCPIFPGNVKRLHWPFEDPAAVKGSERVRKAAFRRIRDQLYSRITAFLKGDESVK
jgi:arsenate reductase (thioredoxin)